MNNETTRRKLLHEISLFRSLPSSTDNATIVTGFNQIKASIADLSGETEDEKNLFIEARNVVYLFSKAEYDLFTKAGRADFPQKAPALARLQEWARRAGDLLSAS